MPRQTQRPYPSTRCYECPLYGQTNGPVRGDGPWNGSVLLIGEAPGRNEDRVGRPFVGAAGKEKDQYLTRAGISPHNCRIANVICCRPPDDRDPTPEEIECCTPNLAFELDRTQARVIGLLGAVACRTLLGPDLKLDVMHGIPQQWESPQDGFKTVVPMYHPAYGIHETTRMSRIMSDFMALKAALVGKTSIPTDILGKRKPMYKLWDSEKGRFFKPLSCVDTFAVDTETTWDGRPWCLSLAPTVGSGFVVMADDKEILRKVAKKLADPDVTTILHNAVFDLKVLARMGIYPARVLDTMVMSYLLQTEAQALKTLALRLCGMEMEDYRDLVNPKSQEKAVEYLTQLSEVDWDKPEEQIVFDEEGTPKIKQPQALNALIKRAFTDYEKNSEVDLRDRWSKWDINTTSPAIELFGKMPEADLRDVDHDKAIYYSARDADATLRVYEVLRDHIEEQELHDTLEIDMDILPMIVDMEDAGVQVDMQALSDLSDYFGDKLDELNAKIDEVAGHAIKVGSPKQIAKLLYEDLKLRSDKTTPKDSPSTDVEALTALQHAHPVVNDILKWRGYKVLCSTFAESLLRRGQLTGGRIYSRIRNTRTDTGRLAWADPNLQNIPSRSEDGRRIRNCFIPQDGCLLLAADYSQIEMKMVAHSSGDETMLAIFNAEQDLHAQTASKIFGVPIDHVDEKEHRYPAKTVGFGVLYGIGAEGLYNILSEAGCKGWTIESCAELIEDWFRTFPGVRRYFSHVCAEARRTGHVHGPFGRMRLIPEVHSALKWVQSKGDRQACSAVVQGGAQDIIKKAMGDMVPVYQDFRKEGICNPLIQIHDELLWEVEVGMVEDFGAVVKAVMENAVVLKTPLVVDLECGMEWGSLETLEL